MNAAQHLAQFGLDMEIAREWIVANLHTPKTVYDVARAGGLTSSMIAEVLQPLAADLNAAIVETFFSAHGFDGSALRGSGTSIIIEEHVAPLDDDDLSALDWLFSMNTNGGVLSTSALQQAVLGKIGNPAGYYEIFNPVRYDGHEDGFFTSDELGISGLPGFSATQANLESLYYGTLINTLRSIDHQELQQLKSFLSSNQKALQKGDIKAENQLAVLMFEATKDPAHPSALSDTDIASILVEATATTAQIVGDKDWDIESALYGFLA